MRAGVYGPLLEVSTNRDSLASSLLRPRRTGQGPVGGRSRTRCEIEIVVGRGEEVLAGDGGGIPAGEAATAPASGMPRAFGLQARAMRAGASASPRPRSDRKSTRLNSSHDWIARM